MELLERVTLLYRREVKQFRYPARDSSGAAVGFAFHDEVFPADSAQDDWKYSLSSGVAAGEDLSKTCNAAYAELVERDRLLRSWFGGPRPIRFDSQLELARTLSPALYEIGTYVFPSTTDSRSEAQLEVVGVYGFPKRDEVPLVYGTAASCTLAAALESAERECIQRLGFLWNESVPREEPDFAPTAWYHQEFFLWPASHKRLRAWLDGEHEDLTCRRARSACMDRPRFVDLTPEHLRGRIWIVKALADGIIPLRFGRFHPDTKSASPDGVHPIA
jgi:hypothetical protein